MQVLYTNAAEEKQDNLIDVSDNSKASYAVVTNKAFCYDRAVCGENEAWLLSTWCPLLSRIHMFILLIEEQKAISYKIVI